MLIWYILTLWSWICEWTISFPVHFRNTMITKIDFRFELMPPKDAELNFRGGPWENFSLTSSFKADKGEFELSVSWLLRAISRQISSGSVKLHAFAVVYSVLYTRCIVYSLKDMVHIANFTMKISKIELWMKVDRFLKEILCMFGGHVLALKQFLKQ